MSPEESAIQLMKKYELVGDKAKAFLILFIETVHREDEGEVVKPDSNSLITTGHNDFPSGMLDAIEDVLSDYSNFLK